MKARPDDEPNGLAALRSCEILDTDVEEGQETQFDAETETARVGGSVQLAGSA